MFSASFSLSYFGLLRISEVLSIKISDSAGHLNLKIIKLKTDQTGHSNLVKITKQPLIFVCQVNQVSKYINFKSEYASKLHIHIDNTPSTRFQFQSILHKTLDFLQVPGYYTLHSLCIGMAT